VLMLFMHVTVSPAIVVLPVFLAGTALAAVGLSLLLAALNVKYRDIKYVVPFFTQMALFLTPVLYPLRHFSARTQVILSLNPMAGVVEGFRFAVFGSPVSWKLCGISFFTSVTLLLAGLLFFKRVERTFADVI